MPSDPRHTLVCLPTYNEAENLTRLVQAVRLHLPMAAILVVDDASPDGTGAVADGLAAADARLQVLHRPGKKGLGRAYLAGFEQSLTLDDIHFIVQMDADGSHPAPQLPTLLQAAAAADLVIGSRYVSGGGTQNWGLHRRWLSRFGSLYARAWLGLPVQDLTGGFKVWRRELLAKVLAHPIAAGGYAFQVETTYIAARLGAHIVESPIVFVERHEGVSKMSAAVAWEAFWKVPLMRWRHAHVTPEA